MSQPSRPQAHGPAQRRRRHQLKFEAVQPLEDRCLLAPVVTLNPTFAVATAVTAPAPAANTTLLNVTVTQGTPNPGFLTDAPLTSVSQLTPITSFGGDIVRIEAGPGGPFGNVVYAISRGAGENAAVSTLSQGQIAKNNTLPSTLNNGLGGAINRPGVIYRVDPATGKTNVFFDLNTVIPQFEPADNKGATAKNAGQPGSGLVNWYDITFDPEGYFDGKPSMFVTSIDATDPTKNGIFRIAPDGTFMGMFVDFNGFSGSNLNINPSAILVPPVEDQSFLRGLIAGGGKSGITGAGGPFSALFFDANAYSPGKVLNATSTKALPKGVLGTPLTEGPITGLTASNPDYISRVYSTFTDFGTPPSTIAGLPGVPGNSGVQGISGGFLINGGVLPGPAFSASPSTNNQTSADSTIGDTYPILPTDFRRFQDIAFDQYGYFSQGAQVGVSNSSGGVNANAAGAVAVFGPGGGTVGLTGVSSTNLTYNVINNVVSVNGLPAVTLPPADAGSLFVADLASGLSVSVAVPAPPAPAAGVPAPPATTIRVPVQGPELISVDNSAPNTSPAYNNPSIQVLPTDVGLGGRIVRITRSTEEGNATTINTTTGTALGNRGGVVRDFATNFHTSNAIDSSGFQMSSLSISFSADGTTLYAADDDGIWQFKTVASLASSTSGSITGLNDLRSLGVPYDGKGSAVAVIDSGVDSFSTPFRGRVASGANLFVGGAGDKDTAIFGSNNNTTATTATRGLNGNTGTSTAGNISPTPNPGPDGHGTPIAGVIAQFVPQATIVPVNIFAPYLSAGTSTSTTAGGTNAVTGGANATATVTATSNALSNANLVYQGLNYVTKHPFVNDPVRPGGVSRVIATSLAFGSTETFQSEMDAYKRYPQILISLKDQMKKFRALGIAPIAATGQFGAPFAAGASTSSNNVATANSVGVLTGTNNSQNASVGDIDGISLPAILNEVVSVTGSYSFPFMTGPGATPANPTPVGQAVGLTNYATNPVLVFGNATSLGATSTTSVGFFSTTVTTTTTGLPSLLATADATQFADRILGAANRGVTTDYAAPAIDVPTFRRTYNSTLPVRNSGTGAGGLTAAGTNGTTTVTGQDPNDHNGFNNGGTSYSAAQVTGAFALVSSALGYWSNLAKTGYTADAYLTQPAGVRTLNFRPHTLIDLTAWNNPDGINSILQWTAATASLSNDGTSFSTPKQLFGSLQYPSYSRLSVSNAIAAIEGYEALNYLINVGALSRIDANNNGIITASELQNFADTGTAKGMPTAAAMARLLGGTARISASFLSPTIFGENPDQPDVLQRRFNFFDYSADGVLNGSVTIAQLNMLAHTVLPKPDQFVIVDRQRSSANGYLVAPATLRNYNALQHISPKFQFIPPSKLLTKYRNVSPAKFGVDRGASPSSSQFPVFTLFDGAGGSSLSNATTTTTTSTAPGTSGTTTTAPAGSVTTQGAATATTATTTTGTATTTTVASDPAASGTIATAPAAVDPAATTAAASVASATAAQTTASTTPTGFTPYVASTNTTYQASLNRSIGVPAPVGVVKPLTTAPVAPKTVATTQAPQKTPLQTFLKSFLGIKT